MHGPVIEERSYIVGPDLARMGGVVEADIARRPAHVGPFGREAVLAASAG